MREIAQLQRGSGKPAEPAAEPGEGSAGAGSRASQAGRGIRALVSRDLSVARLELERLRQEGEPGPRAAGARSAIARRKGSRPHRSKSRCWSNRAPISKSCRRKRTSWWKNTARCAPSWPDSKSGGAPSRPRRRAIEAQIARDRRAPAGDRGARWSGSASSAPVCLSDNIELDRRAGELVEEIRRRRRNGRSTGRAGNHAAGESGGAGRSAQAAAHRRADRAGEALADRAGAGEEAGRAEVSGRDQPQGTERAARRTGRRRRSRSGRSRAWKKPSRSIRK